MHISARGWGYMTGYRRWKNRSSEGEEEGGGQSPLPSSTTVLLLEPIIDSLEQYVDIAYIVH